MENLKEMIEKITKNIIEEWKSHKEPKKKVLFIFCDSTAHESFMDQLIALKNQHIEHDLLFLDGETSAWLGIKKIDSTGSGRVIAVDETAPAPIELPKEYDAIVIPEVDVDNAARIALGLKGSIKAEIVFSALMLNKPVIMGKDVPGIKRADRRTLNTLELPETYKKLFLHYKNDLENMGILFTEQLKLHESVIAILKPDEKKEQTNKQESLFNGKLLTADWVHKHVAPNSSITISTGTIITPMAKDAIYEKGVHLLRK
ncbi:hypothetical protein ACFOU2_22570 [Bacillus songklensis]|uniref:Flavoprotein domain-containing protein n=1 Tax=Bacillus songklensis TaxID=1069116 RepID=A0ABV8B9V6_9BACI